MTLNMQARDKNFGQTVIEYIQTVPGELPVDAVGLWQIVPAGREGFDLKGEDLAQFIRLCVFALLKHGAVPVTGGAGTEYDWLHEHRYGNTMDEIADAVVAEWMVSGAPDCDPGGLWFALPSPHVGSRKV